MYIYTYIYMYIYIGIPYWYSLLVSPIGYTAKAPPMGRCRPPCGYDVDVHMAWGMHICKPHAMHPYVGACMP